MTHKISIAYSPDTDDAFMMEALVQKKIPWDDFDFKFIRDDIQKLNQEATQELYDITAISLAAYPSLEDKYILLDVGSSIGDAFGPAIVVRPESPIKSIEDLKGKRIAVPGAQTSAFFAASILLPEFEAVPMYFGDMSDAVLNQQVDAAILIHEMQICTLENNLRKISDLGILWDKRFSLPLPLGGNAIKRSLTSETRQKLIQKLKESIEYGLANREETLKVAVDNSVKGMALDMQQANKYIDMYVNERTLSMQEDVVSALEIMYTQAAELELCKPLKHGLFA